MRTIEEIQQRIETLEKQKTALFAEIKSDDNHETALKKADEALAIIAELKTLYWILN